LYKFLLDTAYPLHLFKELIDVFLTPNQYQCLGPLEHSYTGPKEGGLFFGEAGVFHYRAPNSLDEKNDLKRMLYRDLSRLTGKKPEWGILTGIRPVKLAGEMMEQGNSVEQVRQILQNQYMLHPAKGDLILQMIQRQIRQIGKPDRRSVGLYLGIPFCPTRCLYCSFPSNQGKEEEIQEYLEALKKEIRFVGEEMKALGLYPESLYLGGGTPTTLNADQLQDLMNQWEESFDLSRCREITVEAGRPDTITDEKMELLKTHGVTRISINPQTMKDETLQVIGRNHTAEDIRQAFWIARRAGIPVINADIIAGLPGEDLSDFRNSLRELLALQPENITLHSLAVKRASRLIEMDSQFHHRQGLLVKEMMEEAIEFLEKEGYTPYYLYRQKHMAGALENIGFSKDDTDNIYNIRMMDEHQTIIALGAGGISKVYFPGENRLERVANVSNYPLYIQRIEEMIQRKKINLFQEVETHADQRTQGNQRRTAQSGL
jgi:oxygen-independent coproporphyrinogen-3 oxidase